MSQIYPDYAYNNPIQRGEIFLSTYIGEGYLEKLRPVVVIQNNLGNKHSRSIIVAAVTSKPKKELPVNVIIDPAKYSLEVENCTIMANQIFTIDKDYLRYKKGCLDAEDLGRLDEALKASFDLKNQEGKRMENIVTIQGIRGFIDSNGVAQLSVEDVSWGLGFTQEKNGTAYIRWETVNGYLREFGFSQQVGKDQFIPENIFYRLAMKAKNERAERFQVLVADVILPQIRKTGSYSVKPMSELEILKKSVDLLLEQQKELAVVKENLETVNHRIDSLDAVNVEGDPQQRLVKMVQKLAYKAGITYSNAWNQFKDAFNMAYRTNLTARMNNYCQINNLKKITIPAFLAEFNQLEDGIRVADKLLNM
jgi:mRNA-degrading endonuclease toxin of MazEF toxin-antitoxin module/prophage antirepressor-like protein